MDINNDIILLTFLFTLKSENIHYQPKEVFAVILGLWYGL